MTITFNPRPNSAGILIDGIERATISTTAMTVNSLDTNNSSLDLKIGGNTKVSVSNAGTLAISPATSSGDAVQGSQLFGFRNKIINGNFTALQVINQRGSAARNTTSNAYNYDRWFYHATNTTLTQAIESLSLKASTVYTVNWSGTATCEYIQSASAMATVVAAGGWTAIAKGAQLTTSAITVSSGAHLFVRFVGVTSSLATLDMVQVEEGSLATPFEQRPYGLELSLCQRYCRMLSAYSVIGLATGATAATTNSYGVPMRVAPTLSTTSGFTMTAANGTATPSATPTVISSSDSGVIVINWSTASGLLVGSVTFINGLSAGANLTAEL